MNSRCVEHWRRMRRIMNGRYVMWWRNSLREMSREMVRIERLVMVVRGMSKRKVGGRVLIRI